MKSNLNYLTTSGNNIQRLAKKSHITAASLKDRRFKGRGIKRCLPSMG